MGANARGNRQANACPSEMEALMWRDNDGAHHYEKGECGYKNSIVRGDNVDKMRLMPDECIDLTVTSPPYDNLRTYGGHTWNFEAVAKELFRVTKQGGVVVWVVADATIDGSETGTSFRQALFFMETGFKLHDTMIWVKDGGGAIGSNFCYTQNTEYVFVFSKGKPKAVNLIRDKKNLSAGKDKSAVGRRNTDGTHKIEERKLCADFSVRNNWWLIAPERGEHPAVFPEKLAGDHIVSWSNEGDIVLDPFSGSGTTCKMAKKLKRHWIGIEINEAYIAISNERMAQEILC